MDPKKIQFPGCGPDDEPTRKIVDKIATLKSLSFPIVCLPDIHVKERTEGPSSFAAATENTIVPELTAPSLGCGMGAVSTSLTTKDVNHAFFEKFYEAMRQDLGPRYGRLKNMLLWIGIIRRPHNKYDLSVREFENIIKNGARAAVAKYSLTPDTLEHVENHGAVFSREERNNLNFKNILPRISYRSGRHDIGYGFKGNHFLEIQYVEEIMDADTAKEWGLQKNQIIIMYHGGGGAVSYHIGRYFGNRKKNTFSQKLVLAFFKILFHFGSLKDRKDFGKRLRYYFFPKRFMEINLSTDEGKRLMLATKASLNYSYAFRMAIIRRITDNLEKILPKKQINARLIWDCAHNTITEETINGKKAVVHRHTANRVFDGKPVILSGFNTTNSYIGRGLPNAAEYLFSSDHGAGITIKRLEEEGCSKPHPKNYTTHIYRTKPPFKKIIHHTTNEGVDFVAQKLEEAHIMRPVVRLRPLAVFKG